MMTVAAARELRDGEVCFVGIGLPSTAANLARGRHAPDVVLIYESGTIGSKPTRLPLSIGDGDLAETADSVVSVPEIFNYWLQGGRIDVGFLGAAQIDRQGNLNSTVNRNVCTRIAKIRVHQTAGHSDMWLRYHSSQSAPLTRPSKTIAKRMPKCRSAVQSTHRNPKNAKTKRGSAIEGPILRCD